MEIKRNIGRVAERILATTTESTLDQSAFYTFPIRMGLGFNRFTIDHQSGLAYVVGTYEREVQQAINRHVKKGDTVFDIGAHAGYFSLYFASVVGKHGKVFSFEPTPKSFEMLARNIFDNNLHDVITSVYSAVGEISGSAVLVADPSSYENHLAQDGETIDNGISVPVTSVDDFTHCDNVTPSFMKIDVEGAELDVLKGARRTLSLSKPTIVAEIRDQYAAEVRTLMERVGYAYRVISKPSSSHAKRGTPNILFTPS